MNSCQTGDARPTFTLVARILTILAFVFSAQYALAQAQPSRENPATKKDFLEWIKQHAIHIEPWEMNAELTRYLDKALEGKRILFIGEPGHFFSEKYDVQLMLIRYLATKGYNDVFLEGIGASMAPVLDQYVSAGLEAKKESVEKAKYRKQVLSGSSSTKESEFRRRLSASQRRFFDGLRKISESLRDGQGPLRIHPVDIDMIPGGCYHSIGGLLAKYPDQKSLDPIRKLAQKNYSETPRQVVNRLEKLKSLVSDLKTANPVASIDLLQLRNYTDCLLESTVFVVTRQEDGRLDRALVRREPAMFRQAKFALDAISPDAKAIMIAHNNHLSKIGADISRARDPSVGEMIAQQYPGEVFSIWMLYDHGTLLNPMSEQLIDTLESDPMRIESTMIKAGSTYLLPLHSGEHGERYIDRKRRYSYFTWDEISTLTKQTDALLFLDEISPLRE